MENTYNRIRIEGERPRILAGDLNAPMDELSDGTTVSWGTQRDGELGDRWVAAELSILNGLGEFGMVDVFREIHGYGDLDVPDKAFGNRRFDHVFASQELNPVECWYDHDSFECFDGENEYSDHAPIIARFDL